jgi:glycosyltransferase involved in cell wall biosynthesis
VGIDDLYVDAEVSEKTAAYEVLKGPQKVEAFANDEPVDHAVAPPASLPGVAAAVAPPLEAPAPKVSVVIPARNEARNLPSVLAQIPSGVHEVILVDGHSIDDTIAVARRRYPGIRVLQETRPGKGNALYCGFLAATGDIIVTLDADGSADPAEIPRFVAALVEGADFAKGSRFLPGGGSSDITRLRRLGNRFFTVLVNRLFRTRYTDLCYGYNAFWSRCLPKLSVDCDGFEIETLINIRVTLAGLTVREVHSFEGLRLHGASNLNAYRDGRRVLKTILRERFALGGRTAASAWHRRIAAKAAERPVAEMDL